MKLLPLLLVFLLAGCSLSDDIDTPSISTLTIMTYNVEDMDTGGRNVTNLKAYSGIASLLKQEQVDIVLFQEIQAGSSRMDQYADGSAASWGDTRLFNEALTAQAYRMPWYGFTSRGGSRRDFLAVWSRYPLASITSIDPDRFLDPCNHVWYTPSRPVLRCLTSVSGQKIWLYTAHLKSNAGGVVEMNAGMRRAQAFHLMSYIMRNHDPERDNVVIAGDMNSMPSDYDGLGNSTMDYLCLRYDNPWNTKNDFIPINLTEIGAVTNVPEQRWDNQAPGTTHPGHVSRTGYPDATFDHIILSPALYRKHYVKNSLRIVQVADGYNGGFSDHFPLVLTLQFTNEGL
ncbi:MAG TPA: endonuclease/exonuclease/phosphatase family protein [Spirochaetota bacterium]|nr:endonuclease/exonuclease/phosphatase family protein [Spirochaetota bacterium]